MVKESDVPQTDAGEQRSQDLTDRPEGWLGGNGALFPNAQTTKMWEKPQATQSSPGSPTHMQDEWLGGGAESNASSDFSPCLRGRPQQIKIEGRVKSIKENPFFKNFGGL